MTRRLLAYIVRHPVAAWRFHRACTAEWSTQ